MNKLLIFLLLIILAGLAVFLRFRHVDRSAETNNFKKQVGSYVLDIDKTNLQEYKKDIDRYKGLTLVFRPDSSFRFNMKVPFIYDSTGRWRASGSSIDEWNTMNFSVNENISTQFSQCCGEDGTFYMNSTTPQKGHAAIGEIFFRRIN